MNKKDKILYGIIAILALSLVFFLFVKPSINDYIEKKQIDAVNNYISYLISQILNDLQTKGYTAISLQNQTIPLCVCQINQTELA